MGGVGRAAPADASGEELETVRVQYEAAPGCPSEEAFWAALSARTPKVRRGDGEAPVRTFSIRLEPSAGESTGHLVVRALDGSTTERELVGDTCDEVVAALALVAALTVDPNATTRPVAVPAAPVEGVTSAAPAPAVRVLAPPPAPPPRWSLAVSVDGMVGIGAAPGPLFGASPALAASGPRRGWLEPTVRLAFAAAASGTVDVAGGGARFTSTFAALDGCPRRLEFGRFALEPCLRGEVGLLRGTGAGVVAPRTDTHSWLAAGALVRAEWRFLRRAFVEFAGGVRIPLVRTTFFFEPDVTIYRTAPVGGVFSAGLGLRFL